MSFDADGFGTWGNENDADDGGAMDFAASAKITGRLGRLDPIGDDYAEVAMLLIVEDAFEEADGELRPAGYQVIRVRSKAWKLMRLTDGCEVEAVCRFHRGRLTLDHFESVMDRDDPLPDVRLPERKIAINDADGHLPDINEVDKAARAGGWGTLAHSVYRMNVPVHVVFAVKGRSQCLLGSEALAQMVLRQVIEAEPGNVEVIAVAVENHSGGHVHLVLRHGKPGGTPPTWSWPRFIGRIKALASRRIAALPGVVDFPGFQDGYSICSVGGGRQAAEEALRVVEAYVRNQGVQDASNETRVSGSTDAGP